MPDASNARQAVECGDGGAASGAPHGRNAVAGRHYSIQVTPPSAGTYYVWIASAAAGLPINNSHFIRFEVD
jgi:hypothetical protein